MDPTTMHTTAGVVKGCGLSRGAASDLVLLALIHKSSQDAVYILTSTTGELFSELAVNISALPPEVTDKQTRTNSSRIGIA